MCTTRYEWGPHLDFLDPTSLIKEDPERVSFISPLEELTRLALVHSARRLTGDQSTVPHLQKYRQWIWGQLKSTDVSQLDEIPDNVILDKIQSLVDELVDTPASDVAIAIQKITSNITGICNGQVDAMEAIFTGDILSNVFSYRDYLDRAPFLHHLAHSKPSLKVLEIGAGTGAPTVGAWTDLSFPDGRIFYSEYTITDLSTSLLLANKERTKGLANVHHSVLSLSQDPTEQGFEREQYDIIIATNAVHATKSLGDTLKHVRKLLRPNGRLFLQELSPSSKWPNYIFGVLPWWWCGAGDSRAQEPYVNAQRWRAELQAAGFDEPSIVEGSGKALQENNVIIAKPQETKETTATKVTLLTSSSDKTVEALSQILTKRGFVVENANPDDAPPSGQYVISLLEKDEPFFEDITSTQFENFKQILEGLGEAGLFWVTRPSQTTCVSPAYAQVVGAARTIRSEMAVEFATCEVDDFGNSLEQIADVFARFCARDNERTEWLTPDYEYAIRDGVIQIGRYDPFSLTDALLTSEASEPIVLDTKKPGLLTALTWARRPAKSLVGDDVEVDVYAGGLNFRVRNKRVRVIDR